VVTPLTPMVVELAGPAARKNARLLVPPSTLASCPMIVLPVKPWFALPRTTKSVV